MTVSSLTLPSQKEIHLAYILYGMQAFVATKLFYFNVTIIKNKN